MLGLQNSAAHFHHGHAVSHGIRVEVIQTRVNGILAGDVVAKCPHALRIVPPRAEVFGDSLPAEEELAAPLAVRGRKQGEVRTGLGRLDRLGHLLRSLVVSSVVSDRPQDTRTEAEKGCFPKEN